MCVTSGKVMKLQHPDDSYGVGYPANADSTFTLQDCATTPSLKMREQWMYYIDDKVASVGLRGSKSDSSSYGLVELNDEDNTISLMTNTKVPAFALHLIRDWKKCQE